VPLKRSSSSASRGARERGDGSSSALERATRGVVIVRVAVAPGLGLAVVAAAALLSADARACEPRLAPLPGYGATAAPWDRFGCNVVDAFTGTNLLVYAGAILTAMDLSASGADHKVRVAFERHVQSRPFGDAMVVFGYAGLPAIGALLYGGGLASGRRDLTGAGAAALQAMTLTFGATVLTKALTGRPFPNHGGDPTSPDRLEHPEWAREWNGPRLENSAFPSGHVAVATSLASALTAYAVDARWIGWLVYPAAGAVAAGMLSGAHHWLSDVTAGALLGHAVGWSVGSDFRRMQDARASGPSAPDLALVPFPGAAGAALAGSF